MAKLRPTLCQIHSSSTTLALCMNGTAVNVVRYNVLPPHCYWSDVGCDIIHIEAGLYRNLLAHPQRPEISLLLWLYKGGKNSHWSHHHNDVTRASLRLTPYSDQQERKHQSSVSLTLCDGKPPITQLVSNAVREAFSHAVIWVHNAFIYKLRYSYIFA